MSVSPIGREEGDIQAILQDSGFEEDADLRRSLEDLRAFALAGPPEPRADLQALLTPGAARLDLRRRNRQRRMGVVIGAAVVGAMGLGAGAVAASEDFRVSVSNAVVKILEPASQAPVPNAEAAPASPSHVSIPPALSPAAESPSPSATPSRSASASKSARPQTPAPASLAPGNAASAHGAKPTKAPAATLRPRPATPVPATPGAGARPFASLLPLLPALPGGLPDPVPGKS